MEQTYLGDGAYVERDPSGDSMTIWIWCDRPEGRHRVALDWHAYLALTRFADEIWPRRQRAP